jgi:putative DNA methylase
MSPVKIPKKLIEVALPLDSINEACQTESSPFTPRHPRSLHIWWARRRIAAVRAVLFSQLVNDPGYERNLGRGINKEKAAQDRERLFVIIRELVKWENTNNEKVLKQAREEIWKSWRETCDLNKNHPQAKELFNPEKLPAFHDPFAGGGAIPMEAQRLGLESFASDLNPVAVLINKSMIEIPPKFAGKKPVCPLPKNKEYQREIHENWIGARGLAEDVYRYGQQINNEAQKRIGHLYPQVMINESMAKDRPEIQSLIGTKLTVIAWLWSRTVKSPNPAYSHVDVPLISTFVLSAKKGKEACIEPVIEKDKYYFKVNHQARTSPEIENGTKAGKRGGFFCLLSGSPITYDYIRSEMSAGRSSSRLIAVIAEGPRGRVYLSPTTETEFVAHVAMPTWKPDTETHGKCRVNVGLYGLTTWDKLFTNRQLVILNTLADLVKETRAVVMQDAISAGMKNDGIGLPEGGSEASAYADSVVTYLALSVSRWADLSNNLVTWNSANQNFRALFSRQAIPMAWDYVEINPFGPIASWFSTIESQLELSANLPAFGLGSVSQDDATTQIISKLKIISTDPPYYDNIAYADLSDFFYVWLRRVLKDIYPKLFSTLSSPKAEELVATPYRHGSKEAAEAFFLNGMKCAMGQISHNAHPAFPITVYYAFKSSETENDGTASTGWETFLEALVEAGLSITGTWPIRTEREGRSVGISANALASSVILVCRQRSAQAGTVSRRDFIRELNSALPEALLDITLGGVNSPVAPVDLSQAIIGPGMAIYSKYAAVLEADGKPMSVRTALQLINRFLAEDDFDHDTQFCLHWFESFGWGSGSFGDANTLAQAKGTSVDGVSDAGVIESSSGKVRLLRFHEYPTDWSPETDGRTPVWEALHHLIRALQSGGESAAGDLLAHMPARIESIRQLAYRLYTLCERKGWAEDARSYNELITSWEATEAASLKASKSREKQIEMEL